MPNPTSLQGEKARGLFDALGLPLDVARGIALPALKDFVDGELFLEHNQSESIVLDDGRIRSVAYDVSGGFGLRGVVGEGIACPAGMVFLFPSTTSRKQNCSGG